MADITKINVNFKSNFSGELCANSGNYQVGENGIRPYEMLLGSLAGCLYATFLDVLDSKKLKIEQGSFEIIGEKREEIPTTLKTVNIVFKVKCDEINQKQIRTSFEISKKYCSVYHTISKVADINTELIYI